MSWAFGFFSSNRFLKTLSLSNKQPQQHLFSKRHMVSQNKDLLCPFLMRVMFEKCFCIMFKGRLESKQSNYPISWETKTDEDTTQGVGIIITRILASVAIQMLVEKLGNFTYPKNIFVGEREKIGNSCNQTWDRQNCLQGICP